MLLSIERSVVREPPPIGEPPPRGNLEGECAHWPASLCSFVGSSERRAGETHPFLQCNRCCAEPLRSDNFRRHVETRHMQDFLAAALESE
eukprot:3185040-Prymnesium_polylepis.1